MTVELFNDYAKFKDYVESRESDPTKKDRCDIFMGENSPTGSSWWAIVVTALAS